MKLDEVNVGMRVRYIPMHAYGDRSHPDCEIGTVTSKNERWAFVRYGAKITAEATDAEDLVKE